MLHILYEDPDIIVVEKPVGMESQSSRGFDPDMVSVLKNYLKLSTNLSTNPSTKPKEPYVGVIHRLDKPVGGIMVYAKTQKAAGALSQAVREHRMQKTYQAVICGKPVDNVGKYVDYLLKDGKINQSRVVDQSVKESRRAELSYRVLQQKENRQGILSLVEIVLLTGRHHQIRVQFSSRQMPLWGDQKYNSACAPRSSLALFASGLSFCHPISGKKLEFHLPPKGSIFREFACGGGGDSSVCEKKQE